MRGFKIAISGKGGVGKTTIAGTLAFIYESDNKNVLVVDADPNANIASVLGISYEKFLKITPISEMIELIEERTGAKPGTYGVLFKMNPKVDDIPDKFCYKLNKIKLLVMGTIKKGGAGCVCPENVLLKRLMTHLILRRDEVVIMDMVAGVEHLGRATASAVDALIIVVEPGQRSIQTAFTIKKLAGEIGLKNIYIILNKVRSKEEEELLKNKLEDFKILGTINFSEKIRLSDLSNKIPFEVDKKFVQEISNIKEQLDKKIIKIDF
jgi:CO dehydrogenase maturation factor